MKTLSIEQFATPGERKTARRLITECLNRGYTVSVSDGEEWTVKRSREFDAIYSALATTGSDVLRVRDAAGNSAGSFVLIWGNDPAGSELIADYSANDVCESITRSVGGAA